MDDNLPIPPNPGSYHGWAGSSPWSTSCAGSPTTPPSSRTTRCAASATRSPTTTMAEREAARFDHGVPPRLDPGGRCLFASESGSSPRTRRRCSPAGRRQRRSPPHGITLLERETTVGDDPVRNQMLGAVAHQLLGAGPGTSRYPAAAYTLRHIEKVDRGDAYRFRELRGTAIEDLNIDSGTLGDQRCVAGQAGGDDRRLLRHRHRSQDAYGNGRSKRADQQDTDEVPNPGLSRALAGVTVSIN